MFTIYHIPSPRMGIQKHLVNKIVPCWFRDLRALKSRNQRGLIWAPVSSQATTKTRTPTHAHTHKSHRTVAERVSPNHEGKLAQDSYPALHITQPKTIHTSIHSLYKVIYIDNQHGWQSMLMQPRHLYRFATHSCRTEIGPRLYT